MIVIVLLNILIFFLELFKEIYKPFNFIHKHTSFNALHGDSLLEDNLIPLSNNSNQQVHHGDHSEVKSQKVQAKSCTGNWHIVLTILS